MNIQSKQQGWVWLGQLIQDIRYAFRTLLKNPVFTAIAVISLALGIGANTAIFSLVNGILLRSLPVSNPQELRVMQWSGADPALGVHGRLLPVGVDTRKGSDSMKAGPWAGQRHISNAFSYPLYKDLREQCAAQADIFGYDDLIVTARTQGEPFIARGMIVTGNFFTGLGVRPVIGRLFTAEDERPDAAPVVAITYAFWQKQFNLDPGVLGRPVTLNGNSHTIVGVLPREFIGVTPGSDETEFYVSFSPQSSIFSSYFQTQTDYWWIKLMARMKPGMKDTRLQAALDVTFAAQAGSFMKEPKIELSDGRAGAAYTSEGYRKTLLILLGTVGIMLLVACANIAGLSLSRGAVRRHELAVRAALGAGRVRLLRQSLTESLMLALLGGMLGIVLAVWGRNIVSRLLAGSPDGLYYDLSLDLRVLGFTLAMAVVAALLSGLLPAFRASRVDPVDGLKDRAALGTSRLRAGRLLVTAQVALTMLLLVGGGLYIRTLVNLVKIDPGFTVENVLLFNLNTDSAGLSDTAMNQLYKQAQESLSTIPGVRSATLIDTKLLDGRLPGGAFFTLPAHPELTKYMQPQADHLTVSETFFTTLDVPILLGRGFTTTDVEDSTQVVVVNETFVKKYFSKEYPIGQVLRSDMFGKQSADWNIVGVCRDAKYTGIKTDVSPTVYFSYRQVPAIASYFALRTSVPPLSLVSAVRKAMAALNPNIPLSDITTQKAVRDKDISQEIMFACLCGALAVLTVLLSCIGLYGLMAYNVARRTSEIGIRMALGATPSNIARSILREAFILAVTGLTIGVPVALALTRFIKSQLYGLSPSDPVTMIGACVLLIAVSLLSAWIPAHRALRISPMEALRCE